MKQTINYYDFDRAFEVADRLDNFSAAGRRALFEYLGEYEEDCGVEIDLDVIALCCEYTEFEDLADYCEQYSPVDSLDEVEANTVVIRIPDSDGFIIADY